jgi:lipopolysaccharide export system protein LptA
MRRRSAGVLLYVALAAAAWAEPAPEANKGQGLFDVGEFGKSKEPITITADQLDYDYKANVVVYHGTVQAAQGKVVLHSDQLRITFDNTKDAKDGKDGKSDKSDKADGAKPAASSDPDPTAVAETGKVKEIVATGSVRIDQGTRFATGGKAVFDQTSRTVVMTENPVLHDGPNEVAGDRIVVFIDENRSVVEGGRKRVKAVVFPNKQDGVAKTPAAKAADAKTPDAKAADAKTPEGTAQ